MLLSLLYAQTVKIVNFNLIYPGKLSIEILLPTLILVYKIFDITKNVVKFLKSSVLGVTIRSALKSYLDIKSPFFDVFH